MSALSLTLYNHCQEVLLKCGELDGDASLRAMFVTNELNPFRSRLPQASNKAERVDVILDYLLNKRLSYGWPVLPLFLAALRDKYPVGDALRDELGILTDLVQSALLPSDLSLAQTDLRNASQPSSQLKSNISTNKNSFSPGLEMLLNTVENMLMSGTITSSERIYLSRLYTEAGSEIPSNVSETMEWLRIAGTTQDTIIEDAFEAKDNPQHFLVVLEKHIRQFFGGITMRDELPTTISYAHQLFSRTAQLLAYDLSTLTAHQAVWADLIIGDEVTQQSINSLYAMQTRIGFVSSLLDKFIPEQAFRRFQMERDGFLESIKKLTNLFEDLDSYLVAGAMPMEITAEMESYLDDLLYYANRCLLWLNDLAQSATKTTVLSKS